MKIGFRMSACFLSFMLLLQLVLPWTGAASASGSFLGVKIDFLAQGAANSNDYLPDYGEVLAERNGYRYGWDTDHTVTSVVYSTYGAPLENSFIRMQPEAEWEIELPNGIYEVNVAVGDAGRDSVNTLKVGNELLFEKITVPAGETKLSSLAVKVSDGKLVLTDGGEGSSTALQYMEIKPILLTARKMERAQIGLPSEPNKISGNQVILSGKQNNEHRAIPAILVPGLDREIERYMHEAVSTLDQQWQPYQQSAVVCAGCNADGIISAINGSAGEAAVIRTGHLNLDASVTFGSPDKPVFLITDGINTNQKLTITVYGTLIVQGGLNANRGADILVRSPDSPDLTGGSNLRVNGAVHLNSDSDIQVDDEFVAGNLTFNNGQLVVSANRLIVENSLHINTNVDMTIQEEMIVGDLVSNNDTANISIPGGDLFVQDNVHVNNHLNVQTGGVWAVGGNLISNTKPVLTTGAGTEGRTKLKYTPYGLKAEYFSGPDLSGSQLVLMDSNIDLKNKFPVSSSELSDGDYSVRWTGQVEPYSSEPYTFETDVKGGVKLWVDGTLLIDAWSETGNHRQEGMIELEAGRRYDIRMEYTGSGNQPKASLSWASSSVPKEVVPQPQLIPFAVPNLTALPSDGDVTLVWTTSFNTDGYELEVDGDIYPLGVQNQYLHAPLDSGTVHTYRVRAGSGVVRGDWSSLNELWTLPGVPGNIRLQATSDSIRLEWDEVRGAVSYEIETDNTIVNNGSSLVYTEENLNPNLQRTFRVRAVNTSGPGKWSEVMAKSTLPGTAGALDAIASDTFIRVTWDAVSGAQWYDLEVDGVSERVIGTQYVHEGLQPNTTHTYRIRSGNSEGVSGYSQPVSAVTLPSIPEGVRAAVGNDRIRIDWNAVSGATGYDIEVDGIIQDNGINTNYIHLSLAPNSEHTYRVRARNGGIAGQWSGTLTRTTLSDMPVNVRTTATGTEIALAWDPVIGAVGYDVEADGQIVNNELELSYVHAGLQPYSEHTYRIRARNAAGAGPWSEPVTAITTLGKPENVQLVSTADSIAISWDPVPGAVSYEVAADGITMDVGNETHFTHSGLIPASWHVYRIRAKNAVFTGEWSAAFTKETVIGIPVITQALALSDSISLKWDPVVGADSYELEVNGNILSTGSATQYVHSNLTPGTLHTYRVRAKKGTTAGEWSEAVSRATSPNVPQFLSAEAATDSISLEWTAISGSSGYDLEIDGEVVTGLTGSHYIHSALKANTMHIYRVRSRSGSGQVSLWSEPLKKKTVSELIANPGKDNMFNFVVVAPPKESASEQLITVTYDPDAVEVLDLSAVTPAVELAAGPIQKAGMTIVSFAPGEIVIRVHDASKTFVNGIRLLAKTNNPTKITYTVE